MIQVVVPNWVDPRGRATLDAFQQGLEFLGEQVKRVTIQEAKPGPHPIVCWGVYKKKIPSRLLFKDLQDRQRSATGSLVILERGFVKREDYYVVSFNDLNNRGSFPHGLDSPGDRWDRLGVELKPWGAGDEILVVGQVPWDTSCQHVDHVAWVRRTIKTMRLSFPGRVIVFRPHPLQKKAVPLAGLSANWVDTTRPLDKALEEARVVVTFSSTVGVDATIAGRRCYVADRTSMVHDLWDQGARTPERERWANWLAYCQWTHEEMRAGLPWLHLYGGPRV